MTYTLYALHLICLFPVPGVENQPPVPEAIVAEPQVTEHQVTEPLVEAAAAQGQEEGQDQGKIFFDMKYDKRDKRVPV